MSIAPKYYIQDPFQAVTLVHRIFWKRQFKTHIFMKAVIVALIVLLTASQAYGQVFGKKKSKDVDPRDAQIDSLTALTKTLTLQLDSVSGELSKYAVAPDTLKVPGDTSSVLPAAVLESPVKTDSVSAFAVSAPVVFLCAFLTCMVVVVWWLLS